MWTTVAFGQVCAPDRGRAAPAAGGADCQLSASVDMERGQIVVEELRHSSFALTDPGAPAILDAFAPLSARSATDDMCSYA